jgi:type I restriction enzyme S subunit
MRRTVLLSDVVELNPVIRLPQGTEVKFVSMDKVDPYSRKISSFEMCRFTGGSKFQNNDTLLARITPCLENGKTAFVDLLSQNEVGAGSTEFIILRAKSGVTDPKYVYYLSISEDFRAYAIQSMVGTSGRQRVQIASLARFELELPELEMQGLVSQILSSIDEKIELNRRMNETLEQMGQALFKHYFINNLETENWKAAGIDQLANNVRDSVKPPFDNNKVYIALEHFTSKSLAIYNWSNAGVATSNKTSFNRGDIIFGKLRPYFHNVAICPMDGICSTDILVIRPKHASYLAFIAHFLNQESLIDYVTQAAEGTRMPRTSWTNICNFKIPMPDEGLVRQFNSEVQPLLDMIINNIFEIRNLIQTRTVLLPGLMSGKINL